MSVLTAFDSQRTHKLTVHVAQALRTLHEPAARNRQRMVLMYSGQLHQHGSMPALHIVAVGTCSESLVLRSVFPIFSGTEWQIIPAT